MRKPKSRKRHTAKETHNGQSVPPRLKQQAAKNQQALRKQVSSSSQRLPQQQPNQKPRPSKRRKRQQPSSGKRSDSSKKRRPSVLLVFALVMILLGVAMLLYPIVGNYVANLERSNAVSMYDDSLEKMSQQEMAEQLQLAQQYNEALFAKQQNNSSEEVIYDNIINNGGVMGTVDIPAIGVENLPFYHGTSYKTLDKGLGHFEQSSIPIGGTSTRSVITGHSGVQNQVLFTDIRNLEEGDIFFISILGEKLAYEIYSFEEVLPTDVEKVKIVPGEDVVTLLTCTPPGINTYRLLVNGRRIPYKEAIEKEVVYRNFWSYQTIVLLSLGISFVLFLLLWLVYRHLVKRSQASVPEISLRAKKRLKVLIRGIRVLFVLLLLVMISILVIGIYGYTQMQQESELGVVDTGQAAELSAYNAEKILQANYEERQIASVNVANYADAKVNFQENVNTWGIGKLVIPDVAIDLPILAGLNNENLLNGAATYREDQLLGESNYVLLAHSIFNQDVLLHRIQDVSVGTVIYATDFEMVYTYKVFRNEVIEDTEVEVLDKTDDAIITLLRCEGDIGTIYRRIVQGKLETTTPLSAFSTSELADFKLCQEEETTDGILVQENPVSYMEQFGMKLASTILTDPVQSIVPLFLLLVLPIIFLNLIRE